MDNKPNINVTPLIDVLLVLLIIFMIITPVKPTDFKAKIPQEPKQTDIVSPNINTLVVSLNSDMTLKLNTENELGTVQQPEKLTGRLAEVFNERAANGVFREGVEFRADLPEADKIEKTVFIRAPRAADYGSVVKVIDAVKLSGANPISLQIDDLN